MKNILSIMESPSDIIVQKTFNLFQNQKTINASKQLIESGKQIESIFLTMILKSSYSSELFKNNLFHSDQSTMYSEIYNQTISQNISEKGLGLAEFIEKQMLILQPNIK
ncbi:Peptidoglycan hydrolase FlgJ [Buchnera aphidicola (Eriosoma grossulariae)]|uniref:rod-binding protein n=1 Tax=Buchnera aphidicola TaxID=9 RepID=UPI003464C1FD